MRLKTGFELMRLVKFKCIETENAFKDKEWSKGKKLLSELSDIIGELFNGFEFLFDKNKIEENILSVRTLVAKIEEILRNENKKNFEIDVDNLNSSIEDYLVEIFGLVHKNYIIIDDLVKQQENGFEYVYAIGLPKYEYFDDLMDFTKDLNFVFKTTIGKEEKAKLVGFDVGSEWYLIGFDTYVAFRTFGVFVKECYKYLKRKKEDEERIKGLAVDDESHTKLKEAMLVTNQVLIQDGLNKLARMKNGGEELSPEEMSQMLKAIEIFSGLLEQNMKVDVDKQSVDTPNKPALNLPSSDKIRNLLESSNMLFLDNNDDND